jgi:uncharacterized membrane protein
MATQSVVGVYDTMDAAEAAVRALAQSNFPIQQVSLVSQNLQSERTVHGFITTRDVAKSGAGIGAWTGGLFGLLVGAAFLWVPGFGPLVVAGSLASILLGGIEGALAGAAGGGLLGALAGWGISKEHILKYEDQIKGGKVLVIAHGSAEDVANARRILEGSAQQDLMQHTAATG